jgi:hypothetical protein
LLNNKLIKDSLIGVLILFFLSPTLSYKQFQ